MPGVHSVFTAADFAPFKVNMLTSVLGRPDVAVPLLATDKVTYVGDPVVMIIASNRYLAEDAAGAVFVEYEEEPAVITISDAKTRAPIHPGAESNVAAVMGAEEDEDLEAVLAAAPHLITRTFTHQRIAQSPMETRGVVVSREGAEEMTVYMACQSPHFVSRYLAQAFGMPHINFRTIAKDVGGSFGLKVQPWREEVVVVAACMLINKPVKWIEDR